MMGFSLGVSPFWGFFGGFLGDGGTDCHSQCAHWLRNDRFCKGCGTAGRRGRRPLRTHYWWCVGEGLSCPPLCQPIPGHCRGRQSGHFLEIASLPPPPAAHRRFPRPRATARVAPTEGYKECGARWNPPVTASPCQPPLGKGAKGTGDADDPVAVPKISALPYGGRWKF